ncbi:MAG: hypothetical protein ACJ8AW_35840 [Rhodopila sp.]|jgi:hypothetical protein
MNGTVIPFPTTAWRDTLAELADHVDHLSTAEFLFCAALSERRWLTERQQRDLDLLVCSVRQRVRMERRRAAADAADRRCDGSDRRRT